jgi:hypothetical protein
MLAARTISAAHPDTIEIVAISLVGFFPCGFFATGCFATGCFEREHTPTTVSETPNFPASW